jgi:hypothetical protein
MKMMAETGLTFELRSGFDDAGISKGKAISDIKTPPKDKLTEYAAAP